MAGPAQFDDVPIRGLVNAMFGLAPIGIGYWDADLRYRRVNAELAAMNGASVEAHIGRRPSEILPDLGPRLEELFGRVLRSGQPLRDVDVSGTTPAEPGLTRHWLANYLPVHDESDAVVGLAGLIIEVTSEREAHDRADAAVLRGRFVDAELRALYGALPVGVAFLSPDLRYQRVNATLARMNGRSVEEHLGASIDEVLGEQAALARRPLEEVIARREPRRIEAEIAVPGEAGAVRTLEATYFPVVGTDGGLLGVGGVVSDVTDRRRLEREQSRVLQQAEDALRRAEAARVEAEAAREETERGRQRIAFLADAGTKMAESVEWEPTLHAIVHSAVPTMADWCSLTLLEPNGTLRVAAIAHSDPGRERLAWELAGRYPEPPDAPGGTAAVIRSGKMTVIEDVAPEAVDATARDERHRELLRSLIVRHAAIVPLKVPEGVIGALSFVMGDSSRRFAREDLILIRSLAARAQLHLQNARLYEERSHVATTLQAGLRPGALPDIPGLELATRFRPAGDENGVGGDFLDVFASGDQAWTVIVGDVSGKGPEAAAVTAAARHTLRAVSMLDQRPQANLCGLNRALRDAGGHGNYCTAFYGRICPDGVGVVMRYASAGHPPPLLVRADGSLRELDDGRGPVAGATRDAQFGEATVRLGAGDLLLLYTDGVTEVCTDDLTLGERELRAVLEQTAGASAEDVVAAVERRAVELHGKDRRDDIALVAVRVCRAGEANTGR
jgi:PAS domain S-box-containing protein